MVNIFFNLENKQPVEVPKFFIGVDTYDYDANTYCLVRQVNGVSDIINIKTIRNQKAFEEEVENVSKYFNAMKVDENIDKRIRHFFSEKELLDKFPKDFQDLLTNPLANMVFRTLLKGGSPYEMIHLSLTKYHEVYKQMVKLAEYWPGSPLEFQEIIAQTPSQTP